MLSREAVFRQIDADRVEPIQRRIAVEYDNAFQTPLSFRHNGCHHEVTELIARFHESPDDPSTLYLIRTKQGVFAVDQDFLRWDKPFLWRGQWVLRFRVTELEEEGPMLVDIKLKQAADFHGHLCPDLAIGYRASQFALDNLTQEITRHGNLRAIVENTTSAVDAVQQLTGCTLGNRRLRLYDEGRHVYTFVYGEGLGLQLTLKAGVLPPDADFLALEKAIQTGRATLAQTARYQTLLDQRIARVLQLAPEALFDAGRIAVEWPEIPLTSELALCHSCGVLVATSHLAASGAGALCRPCGDRYSRGLRTDG